VSFGFDHLERFADYYQEQSALKLAERTLLGLPIYALLGAFVILGTPIATDRPWATAACVVLLAGITIIRNRLARGFPDHHQRHGVRALWTLVTLTLLACVFWVGLVMVIIWQYGLSREAALTLMVTAGFSVGTVSSQAVRLPVALLSLGVIHAPLFAAVLYIGGLEESVLLLTIAGFTAFLAYLAVQINRSYLGHLRGQLKLEEALRNADAESRAKGEFLANMSHEMRTLMNGVMGMTNLLMDTSLSEKQYSYSKTIRNSANSLLSILNDMLDYSKIQAGALEMEHIDFNIRQLLNEVTNLMAWPVADKGVDFVCGIDPEVPSQVNGDAGRLRQVFINLISNALKFTQEGEISVWVSLGSRVSGRLALKASVRDTGIGISQEKLKLLFQPFEQGDASTNRKFGGTGLGLSICKQLIENMDGEIQVVSKPGRGSTFSFFVMLDEATSGVFDPGEMATASHELRGKHVLVADPSEMNGRWLKILLEEVGCTPHVMRDKEELMKRVRGVQQDRVDFGLAVVDVGFMGRELEELNEWVEASAPDRKIGLICMTPLGADVQLDPKYTTILNKPVRAAQLRRCVLAALLDAEDSSLLGEHPMRGQMPVVNRDHCRILVADDDKLSQQVAIGILNNAGYTADCVSNGRQAVQAMEAKHYDVVLMDCLMPEMDGFQATRALRNPQAKVANPNAVIIALTALARKGDRQKCLDAGMDDFISKPVNALTLIGMIDQYVSTIQPGQAPGLSAAGRAGEGAEVGGVATAAGWAP